MEYGGYIHHVPDQQELASAWILPSILLVQLVDLI